MKEYETINKISIIRDNATTYFETIEFKKFYALYSCFIKIINWNVYFQF